MNWDPPGIPPRLTTERLVLRPFVEADAEEVVPLAGAPDVAATTLRVPHPYALEDALSWIRPMDRLWREGRAGIWALVRDEDRVLLGSMGMELDLEHERAELGYWIGSSFWNQGFCTEAARALVRYAFQDLGLHRVEASHMAGNEASGRVLRNVGMTQEGVRRETVKKWGAFKDMIDYAILRHDYLQADPPAMPQG